MSCSERLFGDLGHPFRHARRGVESNRGDLVRDASASDSSVAATGLLADDGANMAEAFGQD
jgi:hypothetical protein